MSSEKHVMNEGFKKTLLGFTFGIMSKEKDLLGAICYSACRAEPNAAVKYDWFWDVNDKLKQTEPWPIAMGGTAYFLHLKLEILNIL